jgi:hypothetical protein
MRKKLSSLFALIFLLTFLSSCSTVPITGRKQLNLIPSSTMLSMSFSQYDDFIKSNKLSTDKQAVDMVKRVGTRIKEGVE